MTASDAEVWGMVSEVVEHSVNVCRASIASCRGLMTHVPSIIFAGLLIRARSLVYYRWQLTRRVSW